MQELAEKHEEEKERFTNESEQMNSDQLVDVRNEKQLDQKTCFSLQN